jgi:hypothetical protein
VLFDTKLVVFWVTGGSLAAASRARACVLQM